jgi:hypothetical protein
MFGSGIRIGNAIFAQPLVSYPAFRYIRTKSIKETPSSKSATIRKVRAARKSEADSVKKSSKIAAIGKPVKKTKKRSKKITYVY